LGLPRSRGDDANKTDMLQVKQAVQIQLRGAMQGFVLIKKVTENGK